MGVDYSASSGYGFVLNDQDNFEVIAEKLGVEYDDDYELIEELCKRYGVKFVVAGDSYAGQYEFLIGDVRSVDFYSFEPHDFMFTKKSVKNAETKRKLIKILKDIDLKKDIKFYSGLHVY